MKTVSIYVASVMALILSTSVMATRLTCLDSLEEPTTEHVLDLQSCDLDDDDMPAVVKYISMNPSIDTVLLNNNKIRYPGATILGTSKQIFGLNLSHNKLENKGVIKLVEGLKDHKNFKILDIGYNDLTARGILAVLDVHSITSLGLEGNNVIDDKTLTALLAANRFSGLDLSSLHLTLKQVETILKNTRVHYLKIDDNALTDKVTPIIAKAKYLQLISLANNKITDAGVTSILTNPSLVAVDLSKNAISDESAALLATSPTITEMDLSHTNITLDGINSLLADPILTSLRIEGDHIDDDIAAVLAANTTLKSLYIAGNDIQDKGAIKLAANTTLAILDVSSNLIEEAGVAALLANHSIEKIRLDNNPGYAEAFKKH